MIKIYPSTETAFTSNGLGVLRDVISCSVTEERNGAFEVTFKYPITGQHFDDIMLRNIVLVKPNPLDDPQPFRIYDITRPINGVITVNAAHLSYDMSGFIVRPFTAVGIQTAFQAIKANSTTTCPFNFWTDKEVGSTMETAIPMSMRSLLGGASGSILDVYGKGEYKFDKYDVKLFLNRGANNNVTIRYGKNLTDLEQEENCNEVYTGIYPYWYDEEEGLVQLTGDPIVRAAGTYDFERILPVDFTDDFQEKPEEADLRTHAEEYVDYYDIGVPKVSLSISFIELAKSQEYEQYLPLERISLCDTINVLFPKLNVSATAKVIKTVYDPISDKYTSLEIGDPKTDLVSSIVANNEKTVQAISNAKSRMDTTINHVTDLITGVNGGNVVIHRDNAGKPYEILIMDTADTATAQTVLRINQNGIGFSSTGYEGPFTTAWTLDGNFVANFITTGVLTANLLRAGVIQDLTGKLYINLENGQFRSEVTDQLTQNILDSELRSASLIDQRADAVSIQITQAEQRLGNDIDTLENQIDTVNARMTFEVDGLKIFGTAGSAQDSYVRIAADEQEFWAGGEEVLTLSADGIDTKAVYADGNISAGSLSIRPWSWTVKSNGVLRLRKES